jgi:hypothetical protein
MSPGDPRQNARGWGGAESLVQDMCRDDRMRTVPIVPGERELASPRYFGVFLLEAWNRLADIMGAAQKDSLETRMVPE